MLEDDTRDEEKVMVTLPLLRCCNVENRIVIAIQLF